MTDGNIDIKKFNPILWTTPDEQFWAVGENLGATRSVGKDLF